MSQPDTPDPAPADTTADAAPTGRHDAEPDRRYRQKKPPYRPTRLFPHRFCRPTHNLIAICAIALLARDLFASGLVFIIFLALLAALALGVQRLVWNRSFTDLAIEDAVRSASATPHGSGGRMLIARKGWARAAFVFDLAFLLVIVDGVAHIAEPQDYSIPQPTADTYVALALALGFIAGNAYCHRKATDPARRPPRRRR